MTKLAPVFSELIKTIKKLELFWGMVHDGPWAGTKEKKTAHLREFAGFEKVPCQRLPLLSVRGPAVRARVGSAPDGQESRLCCCVSGLRAGVGMREADEEQGGLRSRKQGELQPPLLAPSP